MFSGLVLAGLLVSRVGAAPTAEEIIQKVKARSAEAERAKGQFAYQRVSRVDYLDEKGEVKKNAVRVYEVAPVDGQPVSKLVQVNGRPATAREETNRSSARETGDKSRNLALGEDLLSRYSYQLLGEEKVSGRATWILEFKPKENVKEEGFLDKLVNAMQGTIWVDQQDYEMAKVNVHLGKKVSFFGGIAGAIEKMDLQLIQTRVDSAAWLTEALTLDFTGRKLFSPIRMRCFENCSGFRRVISSAGK